MIKQFSKIFIELKKKMKDMRPMRLLCYGVLSKKKQDWVIIIHNN